MGNNVPTQKSRWDDQGVEPPAGEARYQAGEQPIAEYDNWFNKAVVDDIAAIITFLRNLGLTKIYQDLEENKPASGKTTELFIATDTNKIYRGTGDGWQEVPVLSWEDIKNKPSAFPPETHTHDASEIASGVLSVDRIPSLPRSKISDFFNAPFWNNIPDKPVMLERVASVYVGSDVSKVTITDLNYARILILGHFFNANPDNTVSYRMFINGDTDSANYYTEVIEVSGTSVTGSNANDCVIAKAEPHGIAPFIIYLARPEGWISEKRYIKGIVLNVYNNGANTVLRITAFVRQVDEDVNITQLDFTTNVGGALSHGSRFRVFNVT